MSRPLDGIGSKVKMAEENIKNLNAEIEAFVSAHPNPYRIVKELQNEGRDYVFKGFGQLDVPLRFAAICGEIIYLLRSSLDHLVWALVEKQGGTHISSHQFPICATREEYLTASKRRRIKGVSAPAEKLIESVQPYMSPNPRLYFLTLLDDWCIIDKHRLLLVVSGAMALGSTIRVHPGEPTTINGMSPPFLKRVTNDGVELFTISLAAAYPNFQADIDFTTQIAIEYDGECFAIIRNLTMMLEGTIQLISLFAGEFN